MKLKAPFCILFLIMIFATDAFAGKEDDAKALIQLASQSSKYPNANYINLIDEAKYSIKSDGSWSMTTRYAAKICNERGRSLANVQLPYNSAFEKIKILSARTISKDGAVVDVKPEEIREVSPYSGFAMYSSVKAKIIIMPAIENGCIIDYEWVVEGKHSIMPTHFWTGWYYQTIEPTSISRFTLEVPAKFSFNHLSYNSKVVPDLTTSKDGKTRTYVWEGRDFDGVDPEPHMPPLSDICPWFEMSSVNSWNDVAAWYWKLVEPRMKSSPEIERVVADLIKGKDTDADKAKAIFYWVEDNIRYVGLEFGAGAYEPHSAGDVFANRYGDCKDQATLLITMLKLAGVKAHPVLVSVAFRSPASKRLPAPGIFDHAIAVAEIDGKYLWMDSTAEICPFGELPEPDRGKEALVVKSTGGEFVKTPEYTEEGNRISQTSAIKLNVDGGITASVDWTSTGASDLSARATYKYAKPNQVKEGIETTAAAVCPDAKLLDYSVEGADNHDNTVKIRYNFEANGWASKTGKFLIFRPSLYQGTMSQTPFSKPERKFDIVFPTTSSDLCETEITLPEGSKIDELPQNLSLKSDFGTYEKTYVLQGDTLKVSELLVHKAVKVEVARYQEVKKFFEDVIKSQKQQIVLRLPE